MESIWSEENKFNKWLEIELLVAEGWAKIGVFPPDVPKRMRERASFDLQKIEEFEKIYRHDVIAFLRSVEESIGEELSPYLHYGLTSSDVIDTANALLLKEAIGAIKRKTLELKELLYARALEYKDAVQAGRTHGIHAEPITFGLKLLGFYSELLRNMKRLDLAEEEISYGKISGAVGTYSMLDPRVEEYVCSALGLKVEPISTQIIPRDRYAFLISVLALLGSFCERIALEIRHLQRTEVSEVYEPFYKGQRGSSAMPHKRNPVLCERLCGLSRLLRGFLSPSFENIALWHERDISHSSFERFSLPQTTSVLFYMLDLLKRILEGLEIDRDKMRENLDLTKGLIFSSEILTKLLSKGVPRNKAYDIVQRISIKAWKDKKSFKDLLLSDEEVAQFLTSEDLEESFDFKNILRKVDYIFSRFKELDGE
ncbi:MAG: adenylosuccinate lyase [bacterium]|nr:MAG: Adenylosuccinate lyase [bacterium 42_11]MDK2871689.1 adenylosuccinate lyase [bacterium]